MNISQLRTLWVIQVVFFLPYHSTFVSKVHSVKCAVKKTKIESVTGPIIFFPFQIWRNIFF